MNRTDHAALIAWTRACVAESQRVVEASRRLHEMRQATAPASPGVPAGDPVASYGGDPALAARVDRMLSRTLDPTRG